MPEPIYGKWLNLDYCAQTAAWFFKPYWKDDKIVSYTRKIVLDAQKYNPRQLGIPFVGYFNKKDMPLKSPKRLAHEVDLIFANETEKSLAIYNFNHLANTPDAVKALKEVFQKYHIINSVAE